MKKYLYGASVQGIQGFIFETNKLREIAGASQLVDNINNFEFADFCEKSAGHKIIEDNLILNAAGNIKYRINKEEDLKKIVRGFPKHIANYAPGISISQAVVEIKDDNDIQKSINRLEDKLKAQRNMPTMPIDIGFMGLERARRTGGVAVGKDKDEAFIDRGTSAKTKLKDEDTLNLFRKFTDAKISKRDVPFDIEEITKKAENSSWIAIIHADGNGLGKVLTNLSKNIAKENREKAFRIFSQKLDIATEKAAKRAFKEVIPTLNDREKYPIRPVVLGGDDLTVIIRADLAYDFTKAYLKYFEEETKNEFQNGLKDYMDNIQGLTACAGIAYIKDSYPFHYGINLAEELTKEAKDVSNSKEVQEVVKEKYIPSSLSFYKVQSSFTDELSEMS